MSTQEKHHGDKRYVRGVCWGVWDGLHVGHLNLLRNANRLCKELHVGVSTDEYILKIKGHKPVFSYNERWNHLEIYARKYFYAILRQDLHGCNKKWAIEEFNPNVIFVGDDWKGKDWEGTKLGVDVIYLPYTSGISSTKLRER